MKDRSITKMSILMCFFVVIVHLTTAPLEALDKTSKWYAILMVINTLFRFVVPCFVFESGFKLYKKYQNNELDIKKFYMSRLKKVVIPYVICYLIHCFYFIVIKKWAGLEALFPGIFYGAISAQLYYVVFTIQLYILFPLIKKLFEKYMKTVLIITLLMSLITTVFVVWDYAVVLFTYWIFYFVLGMYIAKYPSLLENKKVLIVGGLIFVGTTLIMISAKLNSAINNIPFKYYGYVYVVNSSLAPLIFIGLLKKLEVYDFKFIKKLEDFFEPNTYYIFLYHTLFISIANYDFNNHLESLYNKIVQISAFSGLTHVAFNLISTTIFTLSCILILCILNNLKKRVKIKFT